MDSKDVELAKRLLLAAQRLDELGEGQNDPWFNQQADLCREAVLYIKQLQESQARFSMEESGLLHKLTEREVLSLRSGTPLYIVHTGKGSWKDTVSEVFSFLDMNDLKLEGGALLPLEEYEKVWSAYHFGPLSQEKHSADPYLSHYFEGEFPL